MYKYKYYWKDGHTTFIPLSWQSFADSRRDRGAGAGPTRSRARSHLRYSRPGPVRWGRWPGQQHERREKAQRAQHRSKPAGPVAGPRRRRGEGWEDPLGKGKATHSSILAWRIPWTVYHSGILGLPW